LAVAPLLELVSSKSIFPFRGLVRPPNRYPLRQDVADCSALLMQKEKTMHTYTKRILFWIPRVLCILFAVFISLFALDVFSERYTLGEMILAFLIHLIPTFLVVLALVIAWRWESIGTVLFIALALFYGASGRGQSWIIFAPLFLIAALFLVDWIYRKRTSEMAINQ
jgi:hypothetical protein